VTFKQAANATSFFSSLRSGGRSFLVEEENKEVLLPLDELVVQTSNFFHSRFQKQRILQ
jgi:hypothetical protein